MAALSAVWFLWSDGHLGPTANRDTFAPSRALVHAAEHALHAAADGCADAVSFGAADRRADSRAERRPLCAANDAAVGGAPVALQQWIAGSR